jgi:hypothetical protein
VKKTKPAAKAVTVRERCPVLAKVPVGLLRAITMLMVIAAITFALGMAASSVHPMHLAFGVTWANW